MKKTVLMSLLLVISSLSFTQSISSDAFLLVVDVQDQFYRNTDLEQPGEEMVKNINQIISEANLRKIIYVKTKGRVLTISLKGIRVEENDSAPEMDSNLILASDLIFTKVERNAFTEFDLNEFLILNDVKEIILVGLMAEQCIYHTAIGGMEKGYEIYVVPEAILGKSKRKKEKALKKMSKKGIKILPMNPLISGMFFVME